MSTCPNCGRFLGSRHECIGMWRLRFRVVRTTVAGAVVAVIVAGSILVATYGEVSWLPLTVAALVGIVTTLAALRGGSPTTGLGP